MPPRLAHKKSRKGCRRCKDRKVKCSEDWPSCAACSRHGVSCEYGEDVRGSISLESQTNKSEGSRESSELSDNKSSTPGLSAPYPHFDLEDFNLSSPSQHAVELYLLHRYKSCVAAAFPSFESAELAEVWVWTTVDLAFDHPYLLHAVFCHNGSLHMDYVAQPTE